MKKFSPKPSPELSYTIGVFLGDGCVKIQPKGYRYIVKLKVKDKEFVEEFSRILSKLLDKSKPYAVWQESDFTRGNRFRYATQANSKLLVNFLSKSLDNLLLYIKPFYSEFLRGLFDSDGYTIICAKKKFTVKIGLVNSNLKLLKYVKKILKNEFGIYSLIKSCNQKNKIKIIWNRTYVAKKEVYNLTIPNFFNVIKFIEEIKFSIERKQEKMLDAIFLKQNFNPEEAVTKWEESYMKIGREWIKRTDSGDSPKMSF